MKLSLVRRFVALVALIVASISAQAHAGSVSLAMEAVYDPVTGNLSVRPYDSSDDSPWTGADPVFAAFDIRSTAGYLDGASPNFPAGSISTSDSDNDITFASFSGPTISYASPWDFGNVVRAGLSAAQLNDLTDENGAFAASFSWLSSLGSPPEVGRVVSAQPVPEPSTIASLGLGAAAVLGYAGRRRLQPGLRKPAS